MITAEGSKPIRDEIKNDVQPVRLNRKEFQPGGRDYSANKCRKRTGTEKAH